MKTTTIICLKNHILKHLIILSCLTLQMVTAKVYAGIKLDIFRTESTFQDADRSRAFPNFKIYLPKLQHTIYGNDDRIPVKEYTKENPAWRDVFRADVILIDKKKLRPVSDTHFQVVGNDKYNRTYNGLKICKDAKFYGENNPGFCSGFYLWYPKWFYNNKKLYILSWKLFYVKLKNCQSFQNKKVFLCLPTSSRRQDTAYPHSQFAKKRPLSSTLTWTQMPHLITDCALKAKTFTFAKTSHRWASTRATTTPLLF